MATLTKKTTANKNTKTKPKTAVNKVAKKPKERISGHAKGKIWASPDCWDDDFND